MCILVGTHYSGINMYIFIVLHFQLKRKRVGAGQRGSSNPFLAAKDLLQPSESGTWSNKGADSSKLIDNSSGDSGETNKEASSAVTSSIRARANAVAASLSSPTKTGRAMSKKQQKLAEAAKTSRNISQYFAKKQTAAKSQEEVEEGLDAAPSTTAATDSKQNSSLYTRSSVALETGEMSPVLSEMEGVITGENRKTEEQKLDIITIPDEDDVEETHKRQRLEKEEVQDTCKESSSE